MFIPASSFDSIWSTFYLKYENNNELWCNDLIKNNFSTIKSRVLYSHINNPDQFESVTLHMDSKDFRTILSNESTELRHNYNKSTLISRKNSWKNCGKVLNYKNINFKINIFIHFFIFSSQNCIVQN
jgi:hypothetical protein